MIFTTQERKIQHCGLMQTAFAAMGNPQSAVVIHSTRSCSVIVRDAYRKLGERYGMLTGIPLPPGDNLFCTGIGEEATVFGTGDTLRVCLCDVIAVMQPEYVLVASGCVPGMIGDDIEAVCRDAETEFDVPVMLLPGHGFMVPDGVDTVLSAVRVLFDRFTLPMVKAAEKEPEKVLLIGTSIPYLQEEGFADLKEFLGVLGFSTVLCPPFAMDRDAYVHLAEVSAVIAMPQGVLKQEAAITLAEYIAGQLQVPCVHLTACAAPGDCTKQYIGIGEKLGRRKEVVEWTAQKMSKLGAYQRRLKECRADKAGTIHIRNPRAITLLPGWIKFLQDAGFSKIRVQAEIPLSSKQAIQMRDCSSCGNFDGKESEQHGEFHFVTVSYDLTETRGILLSSYVGYREYENILRKIDSQTEMKDG